MAIEASAPRVGQWQGVKDLLPHLWTRIGWDLRARVGAALACLVVAKLANVYVPILFKHMVDALSPKVGEGAAAAGGVAAAVIVVPVGLLLAYGVARVLSQTFSE